MGFWAGLSIGIFLGMFAGVFCMCLVRGNGRAEDET